MSLFNGVVQAPNSKVFNTYAEAEAFIATLGEKFEGLQVREIGYIVNYF